VGKILSFFKTDYTIGNVNITLDQSLLLFDVAGNLKEKDTHLPLVYQPKAQEAAITAVTKELTALAQRRAKAGIEASNVKNAISVLEKKTADPKTALPEDLAKLEKNKARVDQLNVVNTLYDSFVATLMLPDPTTGVAPLAAVTQELAISDALKDGYIVLLLNLENTGGGYLLKKNILTGLGKMPLYHMGGATATYLALSGPEGKVLAGGTVPIYGGFVKTDNLRKELSSSK
jgi:hypothetical protein